MNWLRFVPPPRLIECGLIFGHYANFTCDVSMPWPVRVLAGVISVFVVLVGCAFAWEPEFWGPSLTWRWLGWAWRKWCERQAARESFYDRTLVIPAGFDIQFAGQRGTLLVFTAEWFEGEA